MSAQFEHPDFPREIADAPDIENVPAAESMHTLMGAVAEIHHGVRQILEAMSPEVVIERARASLPAWVEVMAEAEAMAAPSLPTQDGDDDGREAAPLDPKSVHVGDTVTVRFIETGDVLTTKAYQPDDITASGEYVYLLGWPLHRANGTFGLASSHFEILAIEPAPEPEPEWDPAADYIATVRGVPGVRVTWSPVDDDDRSPWRSRQAITDGKWSWHPDSEVTDVRPLVVIDPAAAREALADLVVSNADGDPDGWVEAHESTILQAFGIEVAR